MGKSMEYTDDVAAEICSRMMQGKAMKEICRCDDMPPHWQIYEWLAKNPDFANRYARAAEVRADLIFDDILDIADDNRNDMIVDADGNERLNSDHVQRARLRIDARKWALSKMQPKKYGEKLDLNHAGNLTINIGNQDADL